MDELYKKEITIEEYYSTIDNIKVQLEDDYDNVSNAS